MARILLNSPKARTPSLSLGAAVTDRTTKLSPERLEARLRQRRSLAYVEGLTRLDAGTHQKDDAALSSLLTLIQQELPEISIDELPLGIVSRCYLGSPYEVHTLDRAGSIIQHYKTWESLPDLMERAHGLALHPGYAFIEVYPNRLIAVSKSGDTSIVTK